MKHSVSHSLGRDKARKVACAAFDAYAQRFSEYSPQTIWKTEDLADLSFKVKGIELRGAVEVTDSAIIMELKNVPFLMKPFQGKALKVVEIEIKEWIAKADTID